MAVDLELSKMPISQAKKISQNDSGLSSFNAGNANDHCGDDESFLELFLDGLRQGSTHQNHLVLEQVRDPSGA